MIREAKNIQQFEDCVCERGGKKGIYLYGAGKLGKWVYEHFDNIFYSLNRANNFLGFCDRQAKILKNKNEFKKINVYTLDELEDKKCAYIFICTGLGNEHATSIHTAILETFKEREMNVVYLNYNSVAKNNEDTGIVSVGKFSYVDNNFAWLQNTYGKDIDLEFNDLLDEYLQGVRPIVKGGQYTLLDYQGKYFNIVNGNRVTYPVVDISPCIHMFGDSRIFSVFTRDEDTICSQLQGMCSKYRVRNYGMLYRSIERMRFQILNMKFQKDDWIILGSNWCYFCDEEELIYIANVLGELKDYCVKNGCFFMFMELPSVFELDNKTDYEIVLRDTMFCEAIIEYSLQKKKKFEDMIVYLGIDWINMAEVLNNKKKKENAFIDLHHYNTFMNHMIAEELYRSIFERLEFEKKRSSKDFLLYTEKKQNEFIRCIEKLNYHRNLEEYKEELRKAYYSICKDKVCGCIVMNCNPFTLGHLGLIEKAACQVDILFVFIVEENQSYFSFSDRFDMAVHNTRHLENVFVLRSGSFIISAITFPEYFEKEKLQQAVIDASKDIILFAKEIAPTLNITKRFVGEEPNDAVTNQYNVQLKELLPLHGIELIEMSRCEKNGKVISASQVRKNMEFGNLAEVKRLVPKYTYKLILENYCNY